MLIMRCYTKKYKVFQNRRCERTKIIPLRLRDQTGRRMPVSYRRVDAIAIAHRHIDSINAHERFLACQHFRQFNVITSILYYMGTPTHGHTGIIYLPIPMYPHHYIIDRQL